MESLLTFLGTHLFTFKSDMQTTSETTSQLLQPNEVHVHQVPAEQNTDVSLEISRNPASRSRLITSFLRQWPGSGKFFKTRIFRYTCKKTKWVSYYTGNGDQFLLPL